MQSCLGEVTCHCTLWFLPSTQRLSRSSPGRCVPAGALLGGSQGAVAAFRMPPELGAGANTSRLRLNRLLNQSGQTGRAAGNALGVLGLFFASFESAYGYLNDSRLPDWANSVGAGEPRPSRLYGLLRLCL